MGMMRSPFFLPSGFTAQDIVNIVESNKDNRQRLEKIRQRKRVERKATNAVKHKVIWSDDLARSEVVGITRKFSKLNKIPNQIQYGINLTAWWNELHA